MTATVVTGLAGGLGALVAALVAVYYRGRAQALGLERDAARAERDEARRKLAEAGVARGDRERRLEAVIAGKDEEIRRLLDDQATCRDPAAVRDRLIRVLAHPDG